MKAKRCNTSFASKDHVGAGKQNYEVKSLFQSNILLTSTFLLSAGA